MYSFYGFGVSCSNPPPLNRVWALHSILLLSTAAHTVRPLPPRALFFFSFFLFFIPLLSPTHPSHPPTQPPIPHSTPSIQGDAGPSHPAPFNSVHRPRSFHSCSHSAHISHPSGETLRALRTTAPSDFLPRRGEGRPLELT